MAVAWYILIILAVGFTLDKTTLANSSLATADVMKVALNAEWAKNLLILAGVAGIITSWNAFMIGGNRAVYAMAASGMLPAFLAKIHPKYNTPVNAVLLIGALSVFSPLLGRKALVWFVNAGSLGIVIAYAFVALSFIMPRKNEPDMERPFKVSNGKFVGFSALILS